MRVYKIRPKFVVVFVVVVLIVKIHSTKQIYSLR